MKNLMGSTAQGRVHLGGTGTLLNLAELTASHPVSNCQTQKGEGWGGEFFFLHFSSVLCLVFYSCACTFIFNLKST